LHEPRLRGGKIRIGDAGRLEAELDRPRLDLPGQNLVTIRSIHGARS